MVSHNVESKQSNDSSASSSDTPPPTTKPSGEASNTAAIDDLVDIVEGLKQEQDVSDVSWVYRAELLDMLYNTIHEYQQHDSAAFTEANAYLQSHDGTGLLYDYLLASITSPHDNVQQTTGTLLKLWTTLNSSSASVSREVTTKWQNTAPRLVLPVKSILSKLGKRAIDEPTAVSQLLAFAKHQQTQQQWSGGSSRQNSTDGSTGSAIQPPLHPNAQPFTPGGYNQSSPHAYAPSPVNAVPSRGYGHQPPMSHHQQHPHGAYYANHHQQQRVSPAMNASGASPRLLHHQHFQQQPALQVNDPPVSPHTFSGSGSNNSSDPIIQQSSLRASAPAFSMVQAATQGRYSPQPPLPHNNGSSPNAAANSWNSFSSSFQLKPNVTVGDSAQRSPSPVSSSGSSALQQAAQQAPLLSPTGQPTSSLRKQGEALNTLMSSANGDSWNHSGISRTTSGSIDRNLAGATQALTLNDDAGADKQFNRVPVHRSLSHRSEGSAMLSANDPVYIPASTSTSTSKSNSPLDSPASNSPGQPQPTGVARDAGGYVEMQPHQHSSDRLQQSQQQQQMNVPYFQQQSSTGSRQSPVMNSAYGADIDRRGRGSLVGSQGQYESAFHLSSSATPFNYNRQGSVGQQTSPAINPLISDGWAQHFGPPHPSLLSQSTPLGSQRTSPPRGMDTLMPGMQHQLSANGLPMPLIQNIPPTERPTRQRDMTEYPMPNAVEIVNLYCEDEELDMMLKDVETVVRQFGKIVSKRVKKENYAFASTRRRISVLFGSAIEASNMLQKCSKSAIGGGGLQVGKWGTAEVRQDTSKVCVRYEYGNCHEGKMCAWYHGPR